MFRGGGRATRHGQNLMMEGEIGLPDDIVVEWVARKKGIGAVEARQQTRIGASAVDVCWHYMAMGGIDGLPWRGQDDTPEGECDCVI